MNNLNVDEIKLDDECSKESSLNESIKKFVHGQNDWHHFDFMTLPLQLPLLWVVQVLSEHGAN